MTLKNTGIFTADFESIWDVILQFMGPVCMRIDDPTCLHCKYDMLALSESHSIGRIDCCILNRAKLFEIKPIMPPNFALARNENINNPLIPLLQDLPREFDFLQELDKEISAKFIGGFLIVTVQPSVFSKRFKTKKELRWVLAMEPVYKQLHSTNYQRRSEGQSIYIPKAHEEVNPKLNYGKVLKRYGIDGYYRFCHDGDEDATYSRAQFDYIYGPYKQVAISKCTGAYACNNKDCARSIDNGGRVKHKILEKNNNQRTKPSTKKKCTHKQHYLCQCFLIQFKLSGRMKKWNNIVARVGEHCQQCLTAGFKHKRRDTEAFLSRKFEGDFKITPAVLLAQSWTHENGTDTFTASEMDPWFAGMSRASTWCRTHKRQQIKLLGINSLDFDGFRDGVPEALRNDVKYVDINDGDDLSIVVLMNPAIVQEWYTEIASKRCTRQDDVDQVIEELRNDISIIDTEYPALHMKDATFRVISNGCLIDCLWWSTKAKKLIALLYALASCDCACAYFITFGIMLHILFQEIGDWIQILSSMTCLFDLDMKARVGYLVAVGCHLRGSWDEPFSNGTLVHFYKSIKDNHNSLQFDARAFMKTHKITDLIQPDDTHTKRVILRLSKNLSTAQKRKLISLGKEVVEAVDRADGMKKLNKLYVECLKYPALAIKAKLFTEPYYVTQAFAWAGQISAAALFKAYYVWTHSQGIESKHNVLRCATRGGNLKPVNLALNLSAMMRNDYKIYFEIGNEIRYTPKLDLRKINALKGMKKFEKIRRSPLTGGNLHLVKKQNFRRDTNLKWIDFSLHSSITFERKIRIKVPIWKSSNYLTGTVALSLIVPGLNSVNPNKNIDKLINRDIAKIVYILIQVEEKKDLLRSLIDMAAKVSMHKQQELKQLNDEKWYALKNWIYDHLKSTSKIEGFIDKAFGSRRNLKKIDIFSNNIQNKHWCKLVNKNSIIHFDDAVTVTQHSLDTFTANTVLRKMAICIQQNDFKVSFIIRHNSINYLLKFDKTNADQLVFIWYTEKHGQALMKTTGGKNARVGVHETIYEIEQLLMNGIFFNLGLNDDVSENVDCWNTVYETWDAMESTGIKHLDEINALRKKMESVRHCIQSNKIMAQTLDSIKRILQIFDNYYFQKPTLFIDINDILYSAFCSYRHETFYAYKDAIDQLKTQTILSGFEQMGLQSTVANDGMARKTSSLHKNIQYLGDELDERNTCTISTSQGVDNKNVRLQTQYLNASTKNNNNHLSLLLLAIRCLERRSDDQHCCIEDVPINEHDAPQNLFQCVNCEITFHKRCCGIKITAHRINGFWACGICLGRKNLFFSRQFATLEDAKRAIDKVRECIIYCTLQHNKHRDRWLCTLICDDKQQSECLYIVYSASNLMQKIINSTELPEEYKILKVLMIQMRDSPVIDLNTYSDALTKILPAVDTIDDIDRFDSQCFIEKMLFKHLDYTVSEYAMMEGENDDANSIQSLVHDTECADVLLIYECDGFAVEIDVNEYVEVDERDFVYALGSVVLDDYKLIIFNYRKRSLYECSTWYLDEVQSLKNLKWRFLLYHKVNKNSISGKIFKNDKDLKGIPPPLKKRRMNQRDSDQDEDDDVKMRDLNDSDQEYIPAKRNSHLQHLRHYDPKRLEELYTDAKEIKKVLQQIARKPNLSDNDRSREQFEYLQTFTVNQLCDNIKYFQIKHLNDTYGKKSKWNKMTLAKSILIGLGYNAPNEY